MNLETQIQQFRETFYTVKAEVQKRIVGQDAIIEGVLFCMLANGHALLEGIPGLGENATDLYPQRSTRSLLQNASNSRPI